MIKQQVGGALAVAALGVGTWFGWLGWDTGYQVDAAGNQTGPYEVWQVAGCVLTLAAVLAGAVLLGVRKWWAVAALTVAFTAAWTAGAAATDDSGLFAVGAILVFGGTALGGLVVASVAEARGKKRGSR